MTNYEIMFTLLFRFFRPDFLKRFSQLIGTRGSFALAIDSPKPCDRFPDLHSPDQGSDALRISVTTSFEDHPFHFSVPHAYGDRPAANSALRNICYALIHNIMCIWKYKDRDFYGTPFSQILVPIYV